MASNIKKYIPCSIPCSCGHDAMAVQNRQGVWRVVCTKCLKGTTGYKTEQLATEAWQKEIHGNGHSA